MGVPSDVSLYRLEVLTVPDLANQAPEHIRKIPAHQITAFNIMAAYRAAVKARTSCTRRILIKVSDQRTFSPVLAFPVVTRQDDTPETLLY